MWEQRNTETTVAGRNTIVSNAMDFMWLESLFVSNAIVRLVFAILRFVCMS